MIKTLIHPGTGKTVRFGRKHPAIGYPCLSVGNYILRSLPSPPASVDYSAAAALALAEMYGNDFLGDCVIAAQAHMVGVFTRNVISGNAISTPALFTPDQIISRYSAIGGYVPGEPSTDNGCDMQTALAYWQHQGMMPAKLPANKHKIVGWMKVDPTNIEQMQTAIWLFENIDIGLDLPDQWVNPFPNSSGFTWDVTGQPDPSNGHNVCGMSYNSTGVGISTWGMTGTMTWGAMGRYVTASAGGELYTVLSHDSISRATQLAPNGFDFSQLQADLEAIGG